MEQPTVYRYSMAFKQQVIEDLEFDRIILSL